MTAQAPSVEGEVWIERERVLAASRAGRHFVVLELHTRQVGPHEWDWIAAAFEVTGYIHGKARAGMARARLERAGKWLSPESRAAMSSGRTLLRC